MEREGVPHLFASGGAGPRERPRQGRAGRAGGAIFIQMAACGWSRCRALLSLRAAGGSLWGRRGAAPEPRAVHVPSPSLCSESSVSYQELKDLKKANVLHIDVRERWEIERDGKIPASINIPLNELVEALQMHPADFKELYNQKMPAKSDHVVFSCFAGTRSRQALSFAASLGFSRELAKLNYSGL
uniref:Thiosulfate sulfurtransferase like domain containing 3 n=1 Tax=Coturnix japonica TaxID=93934 RepID=A0A8C2TAZ1_COTJA